MMQLLFLGPFPFTRSQFHKIGLRMSGLTSSPPAFNIYIYPTVQHISETYSTGILPQNAMMPFMASLKHSM